MLPYLVSNHRGLRLSFAARISPPTLEFSDLVAPHCARCSVQGSNGGRECHFPLRAKRIGPRTLNLFCGQSGSDLGL